jgi:hypothetical protein
VQYETGIGFCDLLIRGFLYELVHGPLALTQDKCFFIYLSTGISLQSLFVVHTPGHYQASSLIRNTESK